MLMLFIQIHSPTFLLSFKILENFYNIGDSIVIILSFTLDRNEKVEQHIRYTTYKLIALRFWTN